VKRRAMTRMVANREAMLVELLEFIEAELDPDPAPWSDYFATPEHGAIAEALQMRHRANEHGAVP
jgi:hypothetical protein